ncbi:ARM repeat-containing protein [Exidia glandulosa HHB12029]|uniref:ARM repeat-containing protein n=1 Tax=Exidia glandulosa HHB12029 TaxID=1314781 RepID=A0A165IPV5_EXIGL|nr:ARM repeat-containing protein [Exidia glandulosa HHB12029]
MPYIPLFEPGLTSPVSPQEPHTPNLASSSSSSRNMASIWAPQPLSSPTYQWPDAQQHVYKPQPPLQTPLRAPVPRFPLKIYDDYQGGLDDKTRSPPGAIGEGRSRAVAERSQLAVVEQLLRSLHLDSPEPTPAATPSHSITRRGSPGPLSASSTSSPSALATPDNLSPLMSPNAIDYFPFPPVSYASTYDNQPLFAPQLTPPKSTNSEADALARAARSKSLSSVAPIQSFNPFSIPISPPPPQSMGRHHPLDFSRLPHRHVSMPNAAAPGADWIRPSDMQPLAHPQHPLHQSLPQSPPLINSFALGNGQPQLIRRMATPVAQPPLGLNEPINFLRLLQPSAHPPYDLFVHRIIKSSDQQASIFLQQKLKVADGLDKMRIVDAIAGKGFEMMTNRFGNWAVQRCLESPHDVEERRKLVACMRGRVVELACNCYGTHVLQKALDCDDETRLLIVSELLLKDPATTLINKHASHVFSKIMELTWSEPAPPIFAYFNNALRGKWASLACHETGSLVVQSIFENVEESAKEDIITELIASFGDVVKNQWGSFCVQHLLEHGSPRHRSLALDEILENFLDYATHEQGHKSIQKALKEGGPDVLDKVCKRLCQTPKAGRRAIVVDLALNPMGSQLIATILPSVNKEQRTMLYDAIKRHVVTLRGSKTGSRTVWLFDRMRAYYGFGPGQ